MKTLLTATAISALMATASHAATVTLDFVALAAGNEGGIEGDTLNFGGLDVTITSTADAYLDDLSNNKPAGLGVCSSGLTGSNQCVDAGDDNISNGETVTLTFGQEVTALTDLVFYDADHNAVVGTDSVLVGWVDDFVFPFRAKTSFDGVETLVKDDLLGSMSSFTLENAGTDFYLGSVTAEFTPAPVPLPASILMLGGALGGLGVMRRRRKAA